MKKSFVSTIVCSVFLSLSLFAQSDSRVEIHFFFSPELGVTKIYNVYLPAGYDSSTTDYPVVYFLRLHESEWFNPNLSGRNGTSLKEVADTLISTGRIGEMILVTPCTGSNNGTLPGLVNMLRPDLTTLPGIGSGRFEDYFIKDLIPHIDSNYRTIPDRYHRAIDGFSLGGYSSIALSFRNPGFFCSVGSYEGSIMWYDLDDPETPENNPDDHLWINPQNDLFFGPIFDIPRNIDYMLLHNAINILSEASSSKLDSIQFIRYHIHTGSPDSISNYDRNKQLLDSLATKNIFNTFENLVLAPHAIHNYGFADLHASKSLVKHWETFQQPASIDIEGSLLPAAIELFQNYPNPFNPTTTISFTLPEYDRILIEIYNMLGQKIVTLIDQKMYPGHHSIEFDGKNLSSGVYLYVIRTSHFSNVRKMILLR